MPEISNIWSLIGLGFVLLHQMLGQWLRDRQHRDNTGELESIRAELVECRARWEHVQLRLSRVDEAIKLLARGLPGPDPL